LEGTHCPAQFRMVITKSMSLVALLVSWGTVRERNEGWQEGSQHLFIC
jgi:hypothetical protein